MKTRGPAPSTVGPPAQQDSARTAPAAAETHAENPAAVSEAVSTPRLAPLPPRCSDPRTHSTPNPGAVPAPARTVVVDGPWRQALAVVRSLGRAGLEVIVVHRRGSDYLEKSEHVAATIDPGLPLSSPIERLRALVAAVESLAPTAPSPPSGETQTNLGRASSPLLYYPIGDREIAFALSIEASLPPHWTPVLAGRRSIEICADKQRTAECARTAGLPDIRSLLVPRVADLAAVAAEIGYPCLVKGNNEEVRFHHRKAFILRSPEELAATFADFEDGAHPLLVQTYFEGPRVNVYFFAVAGEMRSAAVIEIVRTDMPDGTGLAVEGVSLPTDSALTEYTRRLVAKLGYHGAGCAQFLVDASKRDGVFLEVNARLGANFAAVVALGLDLPRLSVALVTGEPIDPLLPKEIAIGRRYAWTTGDFLGWVRAIARRQVGFGEAIGWAGRGLRAALTADDHITWDRTDPLPSVWITAQRLFPWRPNPSL